MNLTHDDVKNRTPGMDLVIKAKEPERQELALLMAEYEARGGKVTVVPPTCKAITDDKWQEFVFGNVPTSNRRARK